MFSYVWPRAPRLLPSFPTRRSSDLVLWLFGDSFIANKAELRRSQSKMVHNSIAIENGYNPAQASVRSEEHTSELQSHVNLVCRLLLEKKKKTSGGPSGAPLSGIVAR